MHENLPPADNLPWTISFVIRKRAQIDSYAEIPEDKRPPEHMIWYGTNEDIKRWFDKVFNRKGKKGNPEEFVINIREDEIE